MATVPVQVNADPAVELRAEFGPVGRVLAKRYFTSVRFSAEAEAELRRLCAQGFVVHVMRTDAWVNYLYLAWALIVRGLPPVRAVVNLRRWFTRPWLRAAQRGDFDVRFTYARRHHGSGLVFLKRSVLLSAEGGYHKEDPFPALVAMARKAERPVYLVPELFVWEKRSTRLRPSLVDHIFGSPEAPGFLHSVMAFWRNHERAQFRVGEAINLKRFIEDNPQEPDTLIARKVRSALHHHLARETRAVFGPPFKHTDRLIEECLRDRVLRRTLDEHTRATGRRPGSVQREARRHLRAIAARQSPTVLAVLAPLMSWVFNRIYDGVLVDEAGLDRALRAAGHAPIVLCPSHKSHVDYLVLAWALWVRGYTVPLVAAGANLSFFPLGTIFRRGGAFFLRRSFKGDVVYTAALRAYLKKLVADGIHHEFFPEGGRSRTGKLLPPKLGLITWEVDAVLEGAAKDLYFVPVAIDYEKVVESGSYSKELAGGEKRPEDLKALLSTPRVLAGRYGRIHVTFDEPISLVEHLRSRGLALNEGVTDEQKKGLVRSLGHRIMHGIGQVSTVTPHALVSTALLSHRRRGIGARELGDRIGLLRRIAAEERCPLSSTLANAPSDPTVLGAIQDAMRTLCQDQMVRVSVAKGETIYQAEDGRRSELSFYKNTLMNLLAPRSLVACALLSSGSAAPLEELKQRALVLSRLFKLEFLYQVGVTFDAIFAVTLEKLAGMGFVLRERESVRLAPETHVRPQMEMLADTLRDYLEAYLLAALTLEDLAAGGALDRKDFVKAALDTGRAEFFSGRIGTAEALSRTTLENAVEYFLDQEVLVEEDRQLKLAPGFQEASARQALAEEIRAYLERPR